MITTTQTTQQPVLPPLIKQSATYKMFVPRKVEEKIRYLIRKFPRTEWSGVLFTRHQGNFEDGTLEIYCEDLFPMDLGTSGWTEFKMTEDVTAYIAENIDLFDCDCQLIHSHHTMGAFFSGQDLKTLQTEGNDTNCFVSLIVDTKGTYQAAVTRKVTSKIESTVKHFARSYEFFGEGSVVESGNPVETTQTKEDTTIEYFMLDVQVEPVENHLEYLDTRFDEIEARKKSMENQNVLKTNMENNYRDSFYAMNSDVTPFDWYKDKGKNESKQLSIWPKEEVEEVESIEDAQQWKPNPTIINELAIKMLLCSLIIDTCKIDLKQWVIKHMENKYNKIFGTPKANQFNEWKEFIVEFTINQYEDSNVPDALYDEYDLYLSRIAEALYNKLDGFPENVYLKEYKEVLIRYIYE